MAPIEDPETEIAATEIAERAGERENEALLKALERRRQRRLEEGYPTDYHERAGDSGIWTGGGVILGRPLLCAGNDFTKTDLELA